MTTPKHAQPLTRAELYSQLVTDADSFTVLRYLRQRERVFGTNHRIVAGLLDVNGTDSGRFGRLDRRLQLNVGDVASAGRPVRHRIKADGRKQQRVVRRHRGRPVQRHRIGAGRFDDAEKTDGRAEEIAVLDDGPGLEGSPAEQADHHRTDYHTQPAHDGYRYESNTNPIPQLRFAGMTKVTPRNREGAHFLV